MSLWVTVHYRIVCSYFLIGLALFRFDMSPGAVYDASEFRQSIYLGYGVQFESLVELSSSTMDFEGACQDEQGTVRLQVG